MSVNLSPDDPPADTRARRVHPGETIRRVRMDRGMTMRELARRIGLAPSHLSKIERGLANPSVGTLWTISDELGIPVARLFSPDRETPPLRATVWGQEKAPLSSGRQGEALSETVPFAQVFPPVVDPAHRESIKMAGVEFQRLTPHDDLAIEFMEVRHEVGAGDPESYRHRGREYGLVLEGRLQVEIGFSKHVLEPGWSVAFDSSTPHRVLNIGDTPAVAVWVVVGRNQL